MKYDEIKQEQLVSDNPESATKVANLILESIVSFTENSSPSPLARFYNLMLLINKIDDITDQVHFQALDYLRELKKDTKPIFYTSLDEAQKNTPVETIEGVDFKLLLIADFRNWATKDTTLNSLLLCEKDAKAVLKRYQDKITKRISELRAMPEFKKAKPSRAEEALGIKVKECNG